MRSGPVQKTVRMRGGRCNTHRATQNQRGLHRSRLVPTTRCICRGAGPSAALWQTHEPDDTPAKGHLQHPGPLMSRGGLSQAIPAGSFDAEARAAWQVGMAACNRRTVLQIRRYDPRRSWLWSWAVGVLSTPEKGLLRNLMDGAEAGPQRGRRLSSPWLFCSTYVRPPPNRPCRRFSIPLRLETARPGRGQSGHR